MLQNVGLNGTAILGGLVKYGDVADSVHRHIKSSGNWSCGQCKHVDVFRHFLQLFLLGYTETLFLVYDQQTKIAEFNVFRKQLVCADKNIHLAAFHLANNLCLLFGLFKSGEHFNGYGISSHSGEHSLIVLHCKNCCGNKECHLFSAHNCLEGGP